MGAPDLSFEDEAMQVLNGTGGARGNDAGFDDEVSGLLGGSPRSANQQEANSPYMPTAQNGRVIEMPTQQVQGDPRAGGGGWDNLLQSLVGQPQMNREAQPNPYLMSAYGGLTHGITAGADQLIPGGAGAAIRDARSEAQAQHPTIYGGFNLAGQLASPINQLAAPAQGAGVLAAGARAAAVGGGVAGVGRMADDPNATAGDVARAAGGGALVGGLAGAGVQSISKGLGGMSQSAGELADTARLRAPGMPANEVEAMTPEARAALAAKLEDPANGLTTGTFQGPSGYLKNAQALQARGLGGMQAAEGQIAALPEQPSVQVGGIIDAQRARAAADRTLADPGNVGPANFRDQFANNLQADTLRVAAPPMNDAQRFDALSKGYQPTAYHSNELPWQRAVEQRRNIDGFTNFGSTNAEESAQNAIRKEIGGGLREGIDQSLSSPNVPPELASQWRGGRDQYALASQVGDTAFKAIPNTGLPGSIGEIPRAVMRSGGQGALAAGARAAQGGLAGASGVANAGAGAAPNVAGQALQQWLAGKGGAQQQPANSQASGGSTGGVSGQRAEQALQVNPQLLGKWAPQFEEAQRNGGSEAVRSLITKLVLGGDADSAAFRNGPYKQLSQGQP